MRIGSAALVSLACVLLAESAVTADTKQIKVGVVADLTGSAGAYGTVQKNAYQLASDDMSAGLIKTGGPQISFDVQDAASDPAQVVTLVQKFTSDGSALLIGPTLSGEAKKADPIAVRANLTILATSNTAAGITAQGPCVFRDSLAEEQVVPQAIAQIQSKWHPKTAAIIYGDDNQFTKTDYDIFASALKNQHVDVVDVETYHTGDVDFKAQLTKIAEKKPDLVVVGSLVEEATKILVQAKQTGIKAHMVGGNGLNSPKLISLAGPAAEGVVVGAAYYVGNNYSGNKAFVQRYTKKFGTGPDQFAAQSYAAAQIVAAAVKTGASGSSDFCSAFAKLKVVQTVLGPVSFASTHDVRAASAIVKVSKGAFAFF